MKPAFAILLCLSGPSLSQAQDFTFFETRVRPVLADNCYACHAASSLGGLRLDSREAILKGGKSGAALVPGKPSESLLLRAVRQFDPKLKMPMGGKLKDSEVADLEAWIKAGAPMPDATNTAGAGKPDSFTITASQKTFWSFQKLSKPVPPAVKDPDWTHCAVDRFILAELEKRGLKPVAQADKRTLIRRATFDLTGLPPTPMEVADFLKDTSPAAFGNVVDRLLTSTRYGERWGRYWLDIARYGEDDVRGTMDPPKPEYPNAWRYRDWVIAAFNRDMPYDLFVKAQLAADQMAQQKDLLPALGFLGLGPWYYDNAQPAEARANERNDRVDAVTRGFLGLTVACARCHDHKYDPISTKDYYALAGVFSGTQYAEYPLASADVVSAYRAYQKKVGIEEEKIKEFLVARSKAGGERLAVDTARYMLAARMGQAAVPLPAGLDQETLSRWRVYLGNSKKDYPFLENWFKLVQRGASDVEMRTAANEFQALVLSVAQEKKQVDAENDVLMAGVKRRKAADERLFPNRFMGPEDYCDGCTISLKSMERDRYVLWRDLLSGKRQLADTSWSEDGLFYYGENKVERFLDTAAKIQLASSRSAVEELKKSAPPPYPYLHTIEDVAHPANVRVHLRGSPVNLGDEVPRHFIEVLSPGKPEPFRSGSGRAELAEAIVRSPISARVIANRVWQLHFGRGIVNTPSNLGQLGERPTHPELLDYLAGRLIENGWSLKSLHREIMLSSTYRLGAGPSLEDLAADPENRFYWRSNRRRLDAEAMRDSLLFVAGRLDGAMGGPSAELADENHRRTVYGKVSRRQLNDMLTLFDFPDPGTSSERRNTTNVPLQRLFFLNSDFVWQQAGSLAGALTGTDRERIQSAYVRIYGREATEPEIRLGIEYLKGHAWPQYAQVLLSSNEFLFVD